VICIRLPEKDSVVDDKISWANRRNVQRGIVNLMKSQPLPQRDVILCVKEKRCDSGYVARANGGGEYRMEQMPLDHYISQVHLKKFYSPTLGDRMHALRKSDLKSFAPHSKDVCRTIDGSTNAYLKENRAIEEFLKTVEPKYDAALEKLVGGAIDVECIYTVAGFASYVICCSPAGMRIKSGHLKSTVETEAAILQARGLFPTPPKELGSAKLVEHLRTGVVRVKVDRKFSQAIGIRSILRQTAIFGNFKWDILINDLDDSPFFTSDFPIAVEETRDWRIVNRIVPLAPNLAVRIRPDITVDAKRTDFSFAGFDWRRKKIGRKETVDINRLVVRCAEEIVFFRDDSAWVQKFVARNRNYRIEPNTHNLPKGTGFLLVSTERIAKMNGSA
jgi:hypothetical protein